MNSACLISIVATYVVISLFIYFANNSNRKCNSKMTKNDFIIKFPKIFPIISFCGSLFFVIIIILSYTIWYNETATLEVFIIFLGFILLSLICTFATGREKLIVKGNEIEYYPPFAKKRHYTFDDITEISIRTVQNAESVICYKNNKRIFTVHSALVGYGLFLSRVNKKPNHISKK